MLQMSRLRFVPLSRIIYFIVSFYALHTVYLVNNLGVKGSLIVYVKQFRSFTMDVMKVNVFI